MLTQILQKLKNDEEFRTKTFLCFSLIFNLGYSVFLFVVSILYSSNWFLVMSVYYGLLSTARVYIFTQISPKRSMRAKIVTMLVCGFFLLVINLVVSAMMFILIFGNRAVKHHEITVITLATYTFVSLTMAIISSVRHLKQNNHVYSCAKLVSLISATVSLVTLTNTMLATFGEEQLTLRSVILPLLCGAVSIFIITSAILMVRKAILNLRNLKNEKAGQ